jgi:hypothetical protein
MEHITRLPNRCKASVPDATPSNRYAIPSVASVGSSIADVTANPLSAW